MFSRKKRGTIKKRNKNKINEPLKVSSSSSLKTSNNGDDGDDDEVDVAIDGNKDKNEKKAIENKESSSLISKKEDDSSSSLKEAKEALKEELRTELEKGYYELKKEFEMKQMILQKKMEESEKRAAAAAAAAEVTTTTAATTTTTTALPLVLGVGIPHDNNNNDRSLALEKESGIHLETPKNVIGRTASGREVYLCRNTSDDGAPYSSSSVPVISSAPHEPKALPLSAFPPSYTQRAQAPPPPPANSLSAVHASAASVPTNIIDSYRLSQPEGGQQQHASHRQQNLQDMEFRAFLAEYDRTSSSPRNSFLPESTKDPQESFECDHLPGAEFQLIERNADESISDITFPEEILLSSKTHSSASAAAAGGGGSRRTFFLPSISERNGIQTIGGSNDDDDDEANLLDFPLKTTDHDFPVVDTNRTIPPNDDYYHTLNYNVLLEGQHYVGMTMLAYVYAKLRELATHGYTRVDLGTIDVNASSPWQRKNQSSLPKQPLKMPKSSAIFDSLSSKSDHSTHTPPLGPKDMFDVPSKNDVSQTLSVSSIIRIIMDEMEYEATQETKLLDDKTFLDQHDVSIALEFRQWIEQSITKDLSKAILCTIEEVQRTANARRWLKSKISSSGPTHIRSLSQLTDDDDDDLGEEEGGGMGEEEEEEMRRRRRRRDILISLSSQPEAVNIQRGGAGSAYMLYRQMVNDYFGLSSDDENSRSSDNSSTSSPNPQDNDDDRIISKQIVNEAIDRTILSFFHKDSVCARMIKSGIEIVYFDDPHPDEALYCICVCRKTKQITVIFRGATQPKKFFSNLDSSIIMSEFENPIKESYKDRRDKFMLHKNFAFFMLRKRKNDNQTKIEEICSKIKTVAMDMFPDDNYTVIVAGHSLGGAFATIFSFYATAQENFTKLRRRRRGPIRVFTFGSPRVGDIQFRYAYQYLERKGMVVHARFSNTGDLVPLSPIASSMDTFFFAATAAASPFYKHVGLQIRLNSSAMVGRARFLRSYEITYPFPKGGPKLFVIGLMNLMKYYLSYITTLGGFAENHTISEYQTRLSFAQAFSFGLSRTGILRREYTKNDPETLETYYMTVANISPNNNNKKEAEEKHQSGLNNNNNNNLTILLANVVMVAIIAFIIGRFIY